MPAVRTPGAPPATRTVARPAISPSPLRDRVGYSDHVRFRGYFPVHFIPAYNLPVYASPWPLPDTTQDSVRGCSLGFTAAAISGDRVQRTCTAQLPHHRTYGSVYGGSRSYANALRSRTGDRAIGSGHWRARQRGLCSGRCTKGHGRCRPYFATPLRLAVRPVPHDGDAGFSTDA